MQNDMRDRLVELLRADMRNECDKHEDCLDCPYYNDEDACYEHLATVCADHLIANGVIVPPCKVGDTVYMIGTNIKQDYVYSGWDSLNEKPVYNAEETITYFVYEKIVPNIEWVLINFYTIGKTVFLTKDQAEQKLKEMRVENG